MIFTGSGMSFSPMLNQFVEVRSRDAEDMLDVASAGVTGADCVLSSAQRDLPRHFMKFHDRFRLGIKPMHMDGFMVFEDKRRIERLQTVPTPQP
jgi:hypothetical protein